MRYTLCFFFVAFLTLVAPAYAADMKEINLTLQNHVFTPAEVKVPQGEKVKITLKNEDATAAEFESHDLHREKIVQGHGTISFFVGPLKAGRYTFVDEFHEDTAKGIIIVE